MGGEGAQLQYVRWKAHYCRIKKFLADRQSVTGLLLLERCVFSVM